MIINFNPVSGRRWLFVYENNTSEGQLILYHFCHCLTTWTGLCRLPGSIVDRKTYTLHRTRETIYQRKNLRANYKNVIKHQSHLTLVTRASNKQLTLRSLSTHWNCNRLKLFVKTILIIGSDWWTNNPETLGHYTYNNFFKMHTEVDRLKTVNG